MRKRMIGATAVLAALVLSATSALADATLYRWKDSQGNMVMSDRQPPAGTEFEAISTDFSVVRRVEGEAPPEQVAPAARTSKPEKVLPKKSVYKKNPEYCQSAKSNLETLERPRIRFTDETGKVRFMTEDERAEERQKAMEIVEAHCK